jgi:serine/threonine protein kinase
MDYIEDETLAVYQTKLGGRLSLGDVLNRGIQFCTLLQYLHTRRPQPIIFCDLKPANVMRTPGGTDLLDRFCHGPPLEGKPGSGYQRWLVSRLLSSRTVVDPVYIANNTTISHLWPGGNPTSSAQWE